MIIVNSWFLILEIIALLLVRVATSGLWLIVSIAAAASVVAHGLTRAYVTPLLRACHRERQATP